MERRLCIGGVPIRLRCPEAAFFAHADSRYRNFYVDEDPAARAEAAEPEELVEIDVRRELVAGGGEARVVEEDGSVRLVRGRATASWQPALRRARAVQAPEDREAACDSLLRVLLAHRLPERGGLLVHSAALVRAGRGHLFVGRSRAGKSTVARLSRHTCTVLADDLTIVQRTDAGPRLHGTPFYGKSVVHGTDGGAPLVAIHLLRQAERDERVRLEAREALPRLLRSVVHNRRSRAATERVLQLAAELVAAAPCFELRFRRSADFWRCIDA